MQVPPVPAPEASTEAAFDGLAADYDDRFTRSFLGRLLRVRVWERFDARFPRSGRILDLGCGTGEDAVYLGGRGRHVVALDVSAAMVETARRKAEAAGLAHRVRVRHAAIESLAADGARESDDVLFDGACSNFGAVNCCAIDFAVLARGLAAHLRRGAPLILVVMGPAVPWEWAWYLARGEARTAFRRLRAGGVRWRGVVVRYPTVGALRRAFAPTFRYRRVSALGCLLPPSYAASWWLRHPRVLHTLDRCERSIAAVPPVPWLADHYMLELERR